MTKHEEKAVALFKEGYNCAQAVFAAFSDMTGLDEQTSVRLASSFGGGFGRQREVCGAVSGMVMALGAIYGYDSPTDNAAKKEQYSVVQSLMKKYAENNGSYICRELLGLADKENSDPNPTPRTQGFYQKRPCSELVGEAARLLDEYFDSKTE